MRPLNFTPEPSAPIQFVSQSRLWRRGLKWWLLIGIVMQGLLLLAICLPGHPEDVSSQDSLKMCVASPLAISVFGGIVCALVVVRGYERRCPHCGCFASLRFLEATLVARSRRLANVRTWDYHYDRNGQRVGCTQATRLLVVAINMYLDTYKCDHCGQTVEKKRSEAHT
jgi:hypothetical protein